jgi:hypothetical protein
MFTVVLSVDASLAWCIIEAEEERRNNASALLRKGNELGVYYGQNTNNLQ